MGKYTLGLDLGPNSVGWAIVEDGPDDSSRLIDLGVRVFPEGVDQFDTAKEASRNEQRRVARGMRRQIHRRKRRKRTLRRALVQARLLPADPSERAKLDNCDPYELRSRALRELLAPAELGRIFLHLAQRRGFLSNRRSGRAGTEDKKEVEGMLAEINQLAAQIDADGTQSLGAWLHQKASQLDHSSRKADDHVRNRHTARAMYEAEFEQLWSAQQRFGHADLLNETLKYGHLGRQTYPCKPRRRPAGMTDLEAFGIYGLIFFQRSMYWPASAVGMCELEPKQKRCPRAHRHAQKFRLLQEVNNLRYLDPDLQEELPLANEQRKLLLDKLSEREEMTFDQIRKALGFLESIRFNLERGKRSKLKGNLVDARMAKALGNSWQKFTQHEKDDLVAALVDADSDETTLSELSADSWKLSEVQIESLLKLDLPDGYANLSLVAIDKLLPHLERGLVYQAESNPEASALHAAGYLRRDELRRRLFDKLPDPQRVRDCAIGDLPNPVVRRALVELRKVVNAIVREYGKPAAVHLEMGRDLKTRPKAGTAAYRRYQDRLSEMREREGLRDQAMAKLRENGIAVNRDSISRYLLWQEQNEVCIYSGRPIGFRQLFGGDIDVDHILPRSRSLDDSQTNRILCFRETTDQLGNRHKGNQTPFEWLAGSRPEAYEQVCQRAKQLPYPKYRRFLLKHLELDDFIARQLNDTRYIARLAGEYLRCLFDKPHHVLGLKGQLTAELRHQWGLDTILAELADSPAWQEQSKLRDGEKNRADHRHHAIDALLIALTNRKRLQELAHMCEAGGVRRTGEVLFDPWEGFRDDVQAAIARVRVSHRVERKVSGKLHEETLYGRTSEPDQWVVRKPVMALSPDEIERIRDKAIREIVIGRLRDNSIEFGRAKKVDAKKWKAALSGLAMPSGVPVNKVRVIKSEKTIRPIRSGKRLAFVKPGATHHLCIFEWNERGKRKREAVFVTMLEAIRRIGAGEPVIRRTHPEHPDAKFVMSLSRGELVLATSKGSERLLSFRTAASTQGQIYFVEHSDARKSSDAKKHVFKANTLNGRKVTVDPLGRIRWAND